MRIEEESHPPDTCGQSGGGLSGTLLCDTVGQWRGRSKTHWSGRGQTSQAPISVLGRLIHYLGLFSQVYKELGGLGSGTSTETRWLPPPTQVAISKVRALLSVDLWVGVEVAHTLDVHHNQLMAGTLKCEVAEGL